MARRDSTTTPNPAARTRDDDAAIRELPGQTVSLSHEHFGTVTWTVVAAQDNIATNAASELMPERAARNRMEILPRLHHADDGFELAVFQEMLWMPIPVMVDVVNNENARMRALPRGHPDRIEPAPHFAELSRHELGEFLGLLVGSSAIGRGGAPCWFSTRTPPTFCHTHFEEHMLKYRFDLIKDLIPQVMEDRSDTSAWRRVRGAVDSFNQRRREILGCFRHVIADELMSAFCPEHDTGLMPNITFEPCKPEPLGTMFKCLLDNDTKLMSTRNGRPRVRQTLLV